MVLRKMRFFGGYNSTSRSKKVTGPNLTEFVLPNAGGIAVEVVTH